MVAWRSAVLGGHVGESAFGGRVGVLKLRTGSDWRGGKFDKSTLIIVGQEDGRLPLPPA
jgi:hypothetical protein